MKFLPYNELLVRWRNIPRGLRTLLVLTSINLVMSILGTLFTMISVRPTEEMLKESKLEFTKTIVELKKAEMDGLADFYVRINDMTEALQPYFWESNFLNLAIALTGLLGVFWMANRNINGFHAYIIYSLMACGSMYVFVSPALVPTIIVVVNLTISFIFTMLYAKHLPWLKSQD